MLAGEPHGLQVDVDDAVNISVSSSAITKGETLVDTALNLDAMQPDCIVVRHSSAGVPHQLAKVSRAAIVNAGDGANEHPTQALLDALTIRQHKGRVEGLRVAIIGDILHSRVARSNMHLLTKLGAEVSLAGPGTLVPPEFKELVSGGNLRVASRIEEAIEGADVVMVLRIQRERQDAAFFPSLREYAVHYGLNLKRLGGARSDAIVMHPGPMNRGIEIASDVADGTRSLILDQVANGLAVRMAVLYLLAGGSVLNQNMLAQTKPDTAAANDTHVSLPMTTTPTRSAAQPESVAAGQAAPEEKPRVKSADHN